MVIPIELRHCSNIFLFDRIPYTAAPFGAAFLWLCTAKEDLGLSSQQPHSAAVPAVHCKSGTVPLRKASPGFPLPSGSRQAGENSIEQVYL
jgi:hypothetical protein